MDPAFHPLSHKRSRMKYRLAIIAVAAVTLFGSLDPYSFTKAEQAGEYVVKAAFLYNFAKFVTWPEDWDYSDTYEPSIILTILGKDPFGDAIDTIRGKLIRGKKLEITKVDRVEQIGKCHILFISSSETVQLDRILRYVSSYNVLTVSDMKKFAERGGMVHLVKDGKKVRFIINSNHIRKAGLRISSQLLKLAEIVTSN